MEPRLERRTTKSLSAKHNGRRGFGVFRAAVLAGCIAVIHLVVSPAAWAGTFLDLVTGTGITVTQVNNNLYTSSFGTMNALAIGTPQAGVTALPQGNGTLYITSINLFIKGSLPAGHRAYVTAYVSANFANPSALVMYACPYPSTCTSFAQYSAMSTNSGAPTFMIPQPGITKNTTVSVGIAIWVPDNNGAGAFSGTDSVTMQFLAFDFDNANAQLDNNTFRLNNPVETLQSAVRLTLSTGTAATAHCAFTATGGTPDYTMSFGNVDALGINTPTCGSLFAPATPGSSNAIYWSDYNLTPAFSDQTSTTGTLKASVTVNFATTNVFVVRDAANSSAVPTSAAQFTALSTGVPDTIATDAANRTAVTRFLGIAVTPANGAGLSGAKTATVTFQLTVP
jgi:hypothetical protein